MSDAPSSAQLTLVPLGGLGEIGRNMLALSCGDDIVVIDTGLMFPEQEMLGVDLVIPDIAWLQERIANIRGIVLTHGHEDHIGALPYVLPRLPVPVYGTALTLGFLRNKLREHGLIETTELHTVRPGDSRSLGCFDVEWVHATHSIPDACALVVRTPAGTIVHSGDFKIDSTPVQGEPPDLARLARIGDEGVLLLLSDSTNAEQEGTTPSERTVGEGLRAHLRRRPGPDPDGHVRVQHLPTAAGDQRGAGLRTALLHRRTLDAQEHQGGRGARLPARSTGHVRHAEGARAHPR